MKRLFGASTVILLGLMTAGCDDVVAGHWEGISSTLIGTNAGQCSLDIELTPNGSFTKKTICSQGVETVHSEVTGTYLIEKNLLTLSPKTTQSTIYNNSAGTIKTGIGYALTESKGIRVKFEKGKMNLRMKSLDDPNFLGMIEVTLSRKK